MLDFAVDKTLGMNVCLYRYMKYFDRKKLLERVGFWAFFDDRPMV